MDRNRYTMSASNVQSNGIPRGSQGLGHRQSSFGFGGMTAGASTTKTAQTNRASFASKIPASANRQTSIATGPNRQGSFGSRPSAFGATLSAMKSTGNYAGLGSTRKSTFTSARKSNQPGAGLAFTPQGKGRPSFNPGSAMSSVGRPSSIGGLNRAQDDRNLTDLDYQKGILFKVNGYLVELGHKELPSRFVSTPASSDIRRVFELFLGQMGISIKPGNIWDQDMPDFMKKIGYPYQVPKNLATGTTSVRHRGQLFGVLDWIVDALVYATQTNPDRVCEKGLPNPDADSFPTDSLGIESLMLTLRGEDKDTGLQSLYGKFYGTEAETHSIQENVRRLEQDVKKCEEEIKDFEEHESHLMHLEENMSNHKNYIQEMENKLKFHREVAEKEMSQVKDNINQGQKLIQDLTQRKTSLTQILKEQEFGQDDVKWCLERQKQIKEEIDNEVKSIEELKKTIRSIKLEAEQEERKLRKLQSDIHSCLMILRETILSPSLEPYAGRMRSCFEGNTFSQVSDFLLKAPSGFTDHTVLRDKRCKLFAFIQDLKMAIIEQAAYLEGNVKLEFDDHMRKNEAVIADLERMIANQMEEIEDCKKKTAQQNHEYEQEFASVCQAYESKKKYLMDLDDKLSKTETETKSRVDRLQDILDRQRKELEDFKDSQVALIKEMSENKKKLLIQINGVTQATTKKMLKYKEDVETESQRRKAKTDNYSKKIVDYKKSAKKRSG